MDDEEVVKTIEKEGDYWNTEAVALLYRKYFKRAFLFALKRLKDTQTAEDICEETLLSVIRVIKQKGLKCPEKLGSFIYSTCYNKILKSFREQKRFVPNHEKEGCSHANPLKHLIIQEDLKKNRALVKECIKELNQKRKNIIILVFYQNKSTSEIARKLKISKNNVRKRKHDALNQLRNCIEWKKSGNEM